MSMREAARRVMAAKLVSDVVAAEGKTARPELLGDMVDAGVERLRVTADDGTSLGVVVVSAGRPTAKVVDEQAFTDWVAQRYPAAVVRQVVQAFRRDLLDRAAAAGDPVDTKTGEVIPGVEIVPGEPYLTVRPTPEARERMQEIVAKSGLLAITTGDQP